MAAFSGEGTPRNSSLCRFRRPLYTPLRRIEYAIPHIGIGHRVRERNQKRHIIDQRMSVCRKPGADDPHKYRREDSPPRSPAPSPWPHSRQRKHNQRCGEPHNCPNRNRRSEDAKFIRIGRLELVKQEHRRVKTGQPNNRKSHHSATDSNRQVQRSHSASIVRRPEFGNAPALQSTGARSSLLQSRRG